MKRRKNSPKGDNPEQDFEIELFIGINTTM